MVNLWAWELVPSKVGGGSVQIPGTAGRSHGNHVSGNQPCKQPPTSGVTVKKPTWPNTYHEPLPIRGGKGWALNLQNRLAKQRLTKPNWTSKLEIWWPKQWSIQGSDLQWSVQETTEILLTRAHMQAHGETSSWGHLTDHRDHWTHWFKINLA